MKADDCKKCQHHISSKFDDVVCKFNGGYDYRVIAPDKKGNNIVLMCPSEKVPQGKKSAAFLQQYRTTLTVHN